MKNFKIIVSAILLCVMVLGLSACKGKVEEVNPSADASQGEEIAFLIDGREVTTDEYRYYLVKNAIDEIYASESGFNGDYTSVNWKKKGDDGKTLKERIEEKAKNELIGTVLLSELAEKNGKGLSGDEKNQAETMMQEYIDQNGEEALMLEIGQMGILSKEGFKKVYELSMTYVNFEDDIANNREKYIDKEFALELEKYENEDMVTAQHILIMNNSTTFAAPKGAVEEILARAKFGESFEKLMEQYNEDPGQTAGGYTFGRGVMVPEFEQAAFALDYNEISDVVESSYGYHIIKRIVGAAELREYLKANAEIKEYPEVIKRNSAESVMTDVYNAIQTIEQNQK